MKLTLKHYLFIAVTLIGFIVLRSFFIHSAIDQDAVPLVKKWVTAEFERYQLARTDLSAEEKGSMLQQARQVEFSSFNARGSAKGTIVRVEIKPNPAMPPGTQLVRYYRMRYNLMTGWERTPRPASAGQYLLAFFLR